MKGRPKKDWDLWITALALALGGVLIFTALHLGLTLLGAALWGYVLWRISLWVPEGKGLPLFTRHELKVHSPRPQGRKPWQGPLAAVLLIPLLFFLQRSQEKAAWIWVVLLLAAIVWILGRLERGQKPFDLPPLRPEKIGPWTWGSLLVIGAFFFFFRFGSIPFWMDNDCANCLADSQYFHHGETTTPFKTVWGDNPALPYMLYGLSFDLLGFSFGAAALVSSLAHLAALPLFHGFCRTFLPPGGAWLASLLFVASRWMLNFVRMPREASLLPCFEAAVLFFLVRAVGTGRKRDHILLGVSTALLMQTYLPSRLVLVLLAGVLAGLALYHRKFLMGELPRLGLALLAFGLFFGPLGVWYLSHPGILFDRMSKISILQVIHSEGGWDPLGRFLSESPWMFNIQGGMDGHYNLPGAPLLDPLSGLCFWVGLAWCLSRCRKFPFLFLFSGLFLTFLGVALANSPGHPMRAIATAPFVFLLAGLGADRLARAFSCAWPKASRWIHGLALGAVAASALVWNFDGYFNRTPRDKVFLQANNEIEFLAAKALSKYPKGWDLHLDFDGAMVAFSFTYKKAEQYFTLPDFGLPIRKTPEKGAVLLLDGLGAVVEDLVAAHYPKADLQRLRTYDGRQALWLWELKRSDLDPVREDPAPRPSHGLWIHPLDAKGKREGARWWPALFGFQKWVKGWNLTNPKFETVFSLKESRRLKFHVQGRLRVWVDGALKEDLLAEWGPKDLVLEAIRPGAVFKVEYSPDRGVHTLDLFWGQGEGFAPVPSAAYQGFHPGNRAKDPKDFLPGEAQLLAPYW